jgi:hypothetical protein
VWVQVPPRAPSWLGLRQAGLGLSGLAQCPFETLLDAARACAAILIPNPGLEAPVPRPTSPDRSRPQTLMQSSRGASPSARTNIGQSIASTR